MPVAQLGVLDLSVVTARLKKLLDDYISAWPAIAGLPQPPTITVENKPPDMLRGGGCELGLYLFHVDRDRTYQNTPLNGRGSIEIPSHPLGLNLYYLLTAYDDGNSETEQQAMSIALRCFHEHQTVRTSVNIGGAAVPQEYTLTMQPQTPDEMARLWQATTVSMRLSVVYRVAVVFISPDQPVRPVAPQTKRVTVAALPTDLPLAATGRLMGTRRTVDYRWPQGSPPVSAQSTYQSSPATAAPGQRLSLLGGGLNQPTSSRVYLQFPDNSEHEVTAWRAADPAPPGSVLQTTSLITLDLPGTFGAPPASTPAPGVYQLCVGSDAGSGDPRTTRSNSTAFAIAPRVLVTADPPILAPAGGLYSTDGLGFVAGRTQLFLGTVELDESAGAPAAGEFDIDAAGALIRFRPPASAGAGLFAVRVRVNGVEADPGWWIELP